MFQYQNKSSQKVMKHVYFLALYLTSYNVEVLFLNVSICVILYHTCTFESLSLLGCSSETNQMLQGLLHLRSLNQAPALYWIPFYPGEKVNPLIVIV